MAIETGFMADSISISLTGEFLSAMWEEKRKDYSIRITSIPEC